MSVLENLAVVALIGLATVYLIRRLVFRRSECDCCAGGCDGEPDYGRALVTIQRPRKADDDRPRSSDLDP
jgi:hypothetical protein